MRNGPADDAHRSGPDDGRAKGAEPGRWLQRAGFSVFFDVQPTGPGGPAELRRRTRLYHEETGDDTTYPGWEPTDWVRWTLGRLESARPPSEPSGTTASLVSVEIIDVRLAGHPTPSTGDDIVSVELKLRVTAMAELNRTLGARVVGVLFGPEPR
jgi:hypothetical protein